MIKKNIYSILVALLIMYLSLTNSHTFDKVSLSGIPHIDKFVHFLMYFGLMSVIIYENRRNITSVKYLLMISIVPLFYGILMEILQSTLTTTRTGSIFDAMFNAIGILISVLVSLWVNPFKKKISDSN